ncbi:(deoxy)nucleoside triphosphate pyrophosphohydrolase [Tepidibacter hydrothermalis]|uniref:8-oxo-dGTP diphosphatase n=1 Tax=Tepidibacter hydrothermalis TaxID=3036126 RepID=A0ABY8E9X7_9FIRM|nr:(deoxy)nucleoside triphosphate pyrophosphohydrolase [Tepidibacter hydrothermalis]WFD09737.1 (deoxy)nucleoside triphosphate pyrophosphohydrolase [Tepidibacter hydrothermalis]
MKKYEVVAAIIVYENQILCMQRPKGKYEYVSYKYEFPGGKVELGESKVEALQRELQEEMDINITVKDEDFFMTVDHTYPDFEIIMHSYICRVDNKKFVRKEHVDHKWLRADELEELDWAAADIPIVRRLEEKNHA